jgi:hypothetical protein
MPYLLTQLLNPKNWLYFAFIAIIAVVVMKVYGYGEQRGESKGKSQFIAMQHDKDTVIQKLNAQIENGEQLYRQSLLDSAKTQNDWSIKLQNAESKANEAQAQINIITAHNHVLSDRLRDTTAEANRRASLPETTDNAKSEYIAIANSVINDCSTKYLEMATTVSSQQIDVNKLVDAYPAQ